jgi:predicted heme/steroid binding protein
MKHSALKITLIALIVLSVLTAVSCSATEPVQPTTTVEEPQLLSLTPEELKEFDGQDGRPAYVAIDGNIYDVSAIAAWAGGAHNQLFAGQDLSEPLKSKSPHGVSVLSALPLVGTLEK